MEPSEKLISEELAHSTDPGGYLSVSKLEDVSHRDRMLVLPPAQDAGVNRSADVAETPEASLNSIYSAINFTLSVSERSIRILAPTGYAKSYGRRTSQEAGRKEGSESSPQGNGAFKSSYILIALDALC